MDFSETLPPMMRTPWVHWNRLNMTMASPPNMSASSPRMAERRGRPMKPVLQYTWLKRMGPRMSRGCFR